MKKLLFIILVVSVITACTRPPVKEIVYVPVTDSTTVDSLIYYKEMYRRIKDSLDYSRDSIGEDLFVARYKLGRIKYYNEVAAKGNNIKYLRGWINRVLNDK